MSLYSNGPESENFPVPRHGLPSFDAGQFELQNGAVPSQKLTHPAMANRGME